MTAADAADNFKTVVESYIARNSQGGVWKFAEKGKSTPLVLLAVDTDGVTEAGADRFAGKATLKNPRTKRKRSLEFTVDFSGPVWKVVRVRPAPAER
jgi:hypothetical protein